MRHIFRVISCMLVISACTFLWGCVSTDLVKTMMKDIDGLKSDNKALRKDVDALSLELESLKGSSIEAAETDRKPGMTGEEGSTSFSDLIADLAKLSIPAVPSTATPRPSILTGEEAYSGAQAHYAAGRYREAYQAFSQALLLDSDLEFQGRCYYWMGETMYAQGAFSQALNHFGKVFVNFGTTSKASDALLKIGFTYYELSNYNGARQALNEFLKRFPDHRAVPLAKEKLSRIDGMESGGALSDQ